MTYEVARDMVFYKNGEARKTVTLPKGSVVSSVSYGQMTSSDSEACKKMAKRHRRDHPNSRLVFFLWEGKPRGGVIGQDLITLRQRPK